MFHNPKLKAYSEFQLPVTLQPLPPLPSALLNIWLLRRAGQLALCLYQPLPNSQRKSCDQCLGRWFQHGASYNIASYIFSHQSTTGLPFSGELNSYSLVPFMFESEIWGTVKYMQMQQSSWLFRYATIIDIIIFFNWFFILLSQLIW